MTKRKRESDREDERGQGGINGEKEGVGQGLWWKREREQEREGEKETERERGGDDEREKGGEEAERENR